MEEHLDKYLAKRRKAGKERNAKRGKDLESCFKPRVVHVVPELNPHFYPFGAKVYAPPAPEEKDHPCPRYTEWVNTRYYQKIKNKAIKARYAFARNHCLRKGLSMKQRYECFKLHWKQYKPGTKNTIHQVRNRVQRDCMKYKYNPKLRRMCFRAHVKHYKNSLLAEQEQDDQDDANEAKEMEAIDADMEEDDQNDGDEAEVLLKVAGGDNSKFLLMKVDASDSDSDTNSSDDGN